MEESEEEKGTLPEIVAQVAIGLTITCENVLLIVAIWRNVQLHDTKYLFMASLAVTDTIIGLNSIGEVGLQFFSFYGKGSSFGSTIFVILSIGSVMLSLIQMGIIAVERYLFIARPFFYQRKITPRSIRWIIFIFWILGLSYIASLFFAQVYVIGDYVNLVKNLNGFILQFCLFGVYIFVTAITCMCYALILRLVRKHTRAVNAVESANKVPKRKELIKSLKFFLVVFGLYFLMTFPGFTVEGLTDYISIDENLRGVFVLAVLLNSGVNFLVLIVVDKEFRHIMKSWIVSGITNCGCKSCNG